MELIFKFIMSKQNKMKFWLFPIFEKGVAGIKNEVLVATGLFLSMVLQSRAYNYGLMHTHHIERSLKTTVYHHWYTLEVFLQGALLQIFLTWSMLRGDSFYFSKKCYQFYWFFSFCKRSISTRVKYYSDARKLIARTNLK